MYTTTVSPTSANGAALYFADKHSGKPYQVISHKFFRELKNIATYSPSNEPRDTGNYMKFF